ADTSAPTSRVPFADGRRRTATAGAGARPGRAAAAVHRNGRACGRARVRPRDRVPGVRRALARRPVEPRRLPRLAERPVAGQRADAPVARVLAAPDRALRVLPRRARVRGLALAAARARRVARGARGYQASTAY